MRVGLIGLGAMGANMARNLAQAGMLECVWNRNQARSSAFAEENMIPVAGTPAKLASRVDLVITCVCRDADLLEVIEQILPGLRVTTVVVDTSTVSSGTARDAADRLMEQGVDFLDAPVSGGVEGAKKGKLAMMVGGKKTVLQKARPALEKIASHIVHMGSVGAGQETKAVNQIIAAGINEAVTEALAFGESAGLPMDKLIDVISGGAAGNWFLRHRGPSMTKGRFAPGFKLELHYKDLQICTSMANRFGLKLPLVEAVMGQYKSLIFNGFGEEDISALYRLKRPGQK